MLKLELNAREEVSAGSSPRKRDAPSFNPIAVCVTVQTWQVNLPLCLLWRMSDRD